MTDDLDDLLTALMSATPGGLPYPESSEDINQGANNIKALALALDSRGHAKLIQVGETLVTFNAAVGNMNFPTPFKSGTTPRVHVMGGQGSTPNNTLMACAVSAVSATSISINAVAVSGTGAPSAWVTGGTQRNVVWFAIGDAP